MGTTVHAGVREQQFAIRHEQLDGTIVCVST